MAPEILREEQPSTRCDVYSFSITLFEIFTASFPYEGEDVLQARRPSLCALCSQPFALRR